MLASTLGLLASLICTAQSSPYPEAVFLEIWPSAKSTSLAGAMVALADEADAAYWNPGGLGFQRGLGFTGTTGPWLPGLYPGMTYSFGSIGYGLPVLSRRFAVNFGLNATRLNLGTTELNGDDGQNDDGQNLGSIASVDQAVGLHAGIRPFEALGVGVGFKYIRQYDYVRSIWGYRPVLKTGSNVAVDLGVLCKPARFISAGVALDNLGPDFVYGGVLSPLPKMVRLGVCCTPVDAQPIRARLMLQGDKLLVPMFYGADQRMTKADTWAAEWRDVWKSAAMEITLFQFVSCRIGYFEDINGARGGLVFEGPDGLTQHYSLGDLIAGKAQGRFQSVGICLGMGLGYKDYLRVDISSDAMIYDFPTSNFKVALTVNNLAGMVHEMKNGIGSVRQAAGRSQ